MNCSDDLTYRETAESQSDDGRLHDLYPSLSVVCGFLGQSTKRLIFARTVAWLKLLASFWVVPTTSRRSSGLTSWSCQRLPSGLLADSYDAAGEIAGIRKVAVLELKKGGFCVKHQEMNQATGYCKEIKKARQVDAATEIVAYVLGANLEPDLDVIKFGQTIIVIPMVYQIILRKAHQRTFNLQRRLSESQPHETSDPEVDSVLMTGSRPLFDTLQVPGSRRSEQSGAKRERLGPLYQMRGDTESRWSVNENPWIHLPTEPPYILPKDKAVVELFNRTADVKHLLEVGKLIPEAFVGARDAPVILLSNNPGFKDEEVAAKQDAAYCERMRRNLIHEPARLPLLLSPPRLH